MKKKAMLVDVVLQVRVIIEDHIDPEGIEFDEAVYDSLKKRIQEDPKTYISDGINDYNDDLTNPYDPEYDD